MRALLRIERAAQGCPALRAAYREGRLSWVQAQALVAIVGMAPAHAEAWIAAAGVSVRRLRDEVDRAVILAGTDAEAFARTGGLPDLEAEPSCAADAEVCLQTGAKTTASEETTLPGESAPRETVRAFAI